MNVFMQKIAMTLAIITISPVSVANEMARTDRYTLVSIEARSDQALPLTTLTNVTLGRDIQTVGDAIHEVLKGSGYRWQSDGHNDSLLNNLPLPAVVRRMGPVRLSAALQTLAGEAWILRMDNLHRVVWFEVNQAVIKNDKQ